MKRLYLAILLSIFYSSSAFGFTISGGGGGVAANVIVVDEFTHSDSTNLQDVLDDLDGAISGGATTLVDAVATPPLLVNGTTNVDDAFPGADADITFSLPAATNAVDGYATSTQITALEAIDTEAELEALLELQDLQGAVTDAQVPDTITVDLATSATTATTASVGTTVTITDNESTAETNAIIFSSGGDLDGGNIGLESDGDLTYNPSTGSLSIGGDLTILGDDLVLTTNTDTAILVADGTNFNPVVPSGDVGVTNAGAFSVSDFTIASEATGTLLQYTGAGWEILAPGTAGKFLQSNGAGVAVSYETPPATGISFTPNGSIAASDVQLAIQEVRDEAGGYTNLTSFIEQTAWRVFYSDSAGDITELALGADGTYLKSNGAAAAPTFDTPAGSGDMLQSVYDTDTNSIVDSSEATFIEVRKGSAGTITIGTPVYQSGYNVSGYIEVEAADADNASAMPCIGIATESITNAALGSIITFGHLHGVTTDSYSVGDPLYISTTAGALTSTKPTGVSEDIQKVATVLRSHATLGVIFVSGANRVNDIPNDLGTPAAIVLTNATGFPTLNQNTTGTAAALTANGGNCSAGSYPLGVDATGAVESCTDATTEIDSAIAAAIGVSTQAYDADLTTYAGITPSANVQSFLGAANYAAMAGLIDDSDYDFSGVINTGSATSFELPNSATPTTNALGEIALDTIITDHQPLLQYYDGIENMTVIAIDTAELPALDNEIVKYDAATDKFVLEADGGEGAGLANIVEDTTPQLGGNLDLNTFSISGVDATTFSYLDPTSSVQTQISAITSNIPTALSLGTINTTTVSITSDGAADDVTLPSATNAAAGVATAAQISAIEANTAKSTNVSTALSTGTVGASTYGITSDGGADDIVLAAATNTTSGVATAAQITALEAVDTAAEIAAIISGEDITPATISMTGSSIGPQVLYLKEDSDNGTNYVGIGSPVSNDNDLILIFPTADPAGQLLNCATPSGILFADNVTRDASICSWSSAGEGDLKADGTVPLTANWDVGAYTITGTRFISDIATGTSPFAVSSTTVVTNLNADTVDGQSASYFEVGDTAIVKSDEAETITSNWYHSGTLRGSVSFNTYSSAQTLTAATHNGGFVQLTVAGEITLWDCETAGVGNNVLIWARDAEKIEMVPASGDHFVLFDGTALTADYELDIPATAGTKVSFICTADDTWSVYTETAACTDGGVAD